MPEKNWEKNEKKCLEYLQQTFSTETVCFKGQGGSDSTQSDIIVFKNGMKACYIEAKMDKSQCGQFVLFPDNETKTFTYSSRNHPSEPNSQTQAIIEKMDENFDSYCNPNGSNDLDLEPNLFYDWIIEHYKSRNVEFFIVSYRQQFIIFPTKNFDKYFDVSAKYRIKKSGSSNPTEKNREKLKEFLNKYQELTSSDYKVDGSYFSVHLNENSGKIIIENDLDNNSYQFTKQDDGFFRVTRLSHTFNANVIFSISLKKFSQEDCDLEDFKLFLSLP